MIKIPEFELPFKGSEGLNAILKPYKNSSRSWKDLSTEDKKKIYLFFERKYELSSRFSGFRNRIYKVGCVLNDEDIASAAFKKLSTLPPRLDSYRNDNELEREFAAFQDFEEIFYGNDEELFFYVYGIIVKSYIDKKSYEGLSQESTKADIDDVFHDFDYITSIFNKISEDFGINVKFSRDGLIPVQDEKITKEVYIPTIDLLQNSRWMNCNNELKKVFDSFSKKDYSSTISNTHNFVQLFLCEFLGIDLDKSKGGFGKLFSELKNKPDYCNKFTEGIVHSTQSFLSSERAMKSGAKAGGESATREDALLVMNSAIIFVNYLLNK